MMREQFQTYLQKQADFRAKWRAFLDEKPNFDHRHRLDRLTPFYGMALFPTLSEEQKDRLFLSHVRIMAENLIIFEQVLFFDYFINRNRSEFRDEDFFKPYAQFTFEELYHTMAFRHFLSHGPFRFTDNFILKCRWLKHGFAFIVRRFPGALYICAPRLEALSLAYYQEIRRAYPEDAENSWLKLNRLHAEDELYHIPLNYCFHDAFIQKNGVIRTFVGSLLFFLMLQVMLLRGSYRAMAHAFPEKSILGKLRWTINYLKWSMSVAEAYREARPIMKRHFRKMKPRFSVIFSYLIK